MTLLISQIVIALFTAFASITSLNKDLRSKTEKLKKEATIIKRILYFITMVSIVNSILSYIQSEADNRQLKLDKIELNKNLELLRRQNLTLNKKLTNKYLEQSNKIIVSQEKSASDLKKAADNLSVQVNGSDRIPLFNFTIVSDTLLCGKIRNVDTLPIYNCYLKTTNYSNLENCSTKKLDFLYYDLTCFKDNTIELPMVSSFSAKSANRLELPKFNYKMRTCKYMIQLTLKNKTYFEEAIYIISGKGILKQALKIIDNGGKNIKDYDIINDKTYDLKNVNWQKEFPLPVNIHLKQF